MSIAYDDPDFVFTQTIDKPETGMWHCGPNNVWLTLTHKPTLTQVRLYGRGDHKEREELYLLMDLALDGQRETRCMFPENLS